MMNQAIFEKRTLSLLSKEEHAYLSQWNPGDLHHTSADFERILHLAYQNRVALRALVEACDREIKRPSFSKNEMGLKRAQFLFSVQAKVDAYEFRLDGAAKWSEKANECQKFLNQLISKSEVPAKTFKASFFSGQMSKMKRSITLLDRERVYWGWTRQALLNTLLVLPNIFQDQFQAEFSLQWLAPWLSFLSYSILGVHLLLEMTLMIKNSLTGPWLARKSNEKISALEQFKTQLNARKFSLLDDFLSISSNLIMFLWLTGEGHLGLFAPILSALFCILYVGLITWRYEETATEYHNTVRSYEKDIEVLEAMASKPEAEIEFLKRELILFKNQFEFKQKEFFSELYYRLAILLGMILLCSLAVSPIAIPAAIALAIAFISYAISFVAIFKLQEARGQNAIELREAGKQAIDQERKSLSDSTHPCFFDKPMLDQLSQYEEKAIERQKELLYLQTTTKALLPVVVLSSFIFLPASFGVGLMLVGMALTIYLGTLTPEAVEENTIKAQSSLI